MRRMEKIVSKKLWRLAPVDLGGGCYPARLVLSAGLKNGQNDSFVTEYLMKHRHVMCKTHFKCLNFAGDHNWDGFDCRNCPRAADPGNRISHADILDEIQDLMLLHRTVRLTRMKSCRPAPKDDSCPPLAQNGPIRKKCLI